MGAGSSFEHNSVLCEFLTSHGFVVVGSAFVRLIGEGGDLESFTRTLRRGMDA